MSNIKRFSSRKEVTEFLKERGIDTSNWSEEKWLSINKGQAEIHMMALAEEIYDAMNESTPKQLKENEWHIPFEDKLNEDKIEELLHGPHRASYIRYEGDIVQAKIEISTAMAARTSYTVVGDEKEIDYQKMLELHDKLIEFNHRSPLEHCARAMTVTEYYSNLKGSFEEEIELDPDGFISINTHVNDKSSFGWCRNFKGFKQYRYLIEEKNYNAKY